MYRGAYHYPWWVTTYSSAVESQTSYPNHLPEQIAAANAAHFEPGQTVTTDYLATVYTDKRAVTGIGLDGVVSFQDAG